jgi:hypothetical protein
MTFAAHKRIMVTLSSTGRLVVAVILALALFAISQAQ